MKSIAVCGSTLVDKIFQTDYYPSCGELAKINDVSASLGGLLPNVSTDIKLLRADIPVLAYGRVGNDADGKNVLSTLKKAGVDVCGIKTDERLNTGFSAIVSVVGGQRTFFTYNGANDNFAQQDVDLSNPDIAYLHLGYFALLDKMDNGDGLQLLKQAKSKGIKTSIDLVSSSSYDFSHIVPCLPYVDNLIINELEASLLSGVAVSGACDLQKVATKLWQMGVGERVIIHMTECAVCLSHEGFVMVPSLDISKDKIVGTTGAGDAFCSACLVAIYDGMPNKQMLEFATMVAASSLFSQDACGSIIDQKEIYRQFKDCKRKELCL